MSLFDKAKNALKKNAGKVAGGVDKATDAADKKTGGKYRDQLDKVDDKATELADQHGHDDTPTPSTPPTVDRRPGQP